MNKLKDFTARELTSQHVELMDEIENLPPGTEISPFMKKKKVALEEDLRRRLYSLLLGDVLPIIPMVIKVIEKKALIIFHFDVLSELNTLIDRFKINATTKDEAWKEAREKAETYPGQVSLKIS